MLKLGPENRKCFEYESGKGYFRQETSRNTDIEEIMYLEDIKTERRGVVGSCSISYCYNTDTSQYNSKLREFKKVIYSQEPVGWLGQLCFIMWVCSCVPASWVSHSWGSN